MSVSSLFYGMEAYLDSNKAIASGDTVSATNQLAEIASDVADINSEAKDNEVQAQMLLYMGKLYTHVKQYGIDRTFLSIYNANHELDRMCGIRFPSCESMPTTGNPYDQYSSKFIAAMEDENTGFWHKIWEGIQTVWNWIKTKFITFWHKLLQVLGLRLKNLGELIQEMQQTYDLTQDAEIEKYDYIQLIVHQEVLKDFIGSVEQFKQVTQIYMTCMDLANREQDYDQLNNPVDDDLYKQRPDTITASIEECQQELTKEKKVENKTKSIKLTKLLKDARTYCKNISSNIAFCDSIQNDLVKHEKTMMSNIKSKDPNKIDDKYKKRLIFLVGTPKKILSFASTLGNILIKYSDGAYRDLKSLSKTLKTKSS